MYLEGYQESCHPRPEGKLLPIAYRIAPRGRLNERDLMSPPPLSRRARQGAAGALASQRFISP